MCRICWRRVRRDEPLMGWNGKMSREREWPGNRWCSRGWNSGEERVFSGATSVTDPAKRGVKLTHITNLSILGYSWEPHLSASESTLLCTCRKGITRHGFMTPRTPQCTFAACILRYATRATVYMPPTPSGPWIPIIYPRQEMKP